MCGKKTIIGGGSNAKDEKDQQRPGDSDTIVEQIDGTSYAFDTEGCATMFKRFSSVYGNNFADE